MSAPIPSSTGHAFAEARYLDLHFESSRPEYEAALRDVGLQPGWHVLDAGCGGGSFLPLIAELVGPGGRVSALDLAPENVARAKEILDVDARTGSVLALPFEDATFDCVWSANVVQYLTEAEFDLAIAEFRRVLKPGGMVAIKEIDTTLLHVYPFDAGTIARLVAARRAKSGIIGPWRGAALPSMLRRTGLADIGRRGWFVERWAPAPEPTRNFVAQILVSFAGIAAQHDLPAADQESWRAVAADPACVLNDPDFCLREFFVVATGRTAA